MRTGQLMGREERALAQAPRTVPVTYTEAEAAGSWGRLAEVLAGIDRQLAVAADDVTAGSLASVAIKEAQKNLTWFRGVFDVMKAAAVETARGL